MSKALYYLAIFFLAIAVIAGILQSVILLRQGPSAVYLQSYLYWFLAFNVTYIIAHGFVLCHFYFKQWTFAFVSGIISFIFFFAQFIFQYYMLSTASREITIYHSLLVFGGIITTIVFSAALIFSRAREQKILRALGIITIATTIPYLYAIIGMGKFLSPMQAMQILIWVGMASSLFPVFYIMMFRREIRQTPDFTNPSRLQEALFHALGMSGAIAAIALLMLGRQLSLESYWWSDWQDRASEENEKLAEPFERMVYVSSKGDSLRYLLLKPLQYDSISKYPLVICLHGGPTQVANSLEVAQPAPLLSRQDNRAKYPSFVFVPQGRPGTLWGGIPGVPSMDTIVFEAMADLENKFNIDEKRRYVAGGSGGGYGSWYFISTRPDMFAAAVPICGVGDPSYAQKIANIPVWAFHGDADRNVSVAGSRNMIEAIRKAGGNPKYNEYEGVGHNVWPEIEKSEDVLKWMFEQRKN